MTKTLLKRSVFILIGTALGLFFLYLAFRDIVWSELVAGIKEMQPIYLIPAVLLMMTAQFIRALRFGVILKPFCKLSTKQLWDLLNIWAGATIFLPARLGELVRPYLLKKRGVSFSSTIGAIMVERLFDLLSLLLLLAVVLWKNTQIRAEYSYIGLILLVGLLMGYVVVLLMLFNRGVADRVFQRVTGWLPERIRVFLNTIFTKVLDGLGVMASLKQACLIFLYSLAIWTTFSAMTYVFLLAFSIKAPFLVAVTVQIFICFGVALPSTPGFIGTFHAAGRYALTLFGITAVVAVSFATVYHLFSVLMCLILGMMSYVWSDFRLDRKMFAEEPEGEDSEGPPNEKLRTVVGASEKSRFASASE